MYLLSPRFSITRALMWNAACKQKSSVVGNQTGVSHAAKDVVDAMASLAMRQASRCCHHQQGTSIVYSVRYVEW